MRKKDKLFDAAARELEKICEESATWELDEPSANFVCEQMSLANALHKFAMPKTLLTLGLAAGLAGT